MLNEIELSFAYRYSNFGIIVFRLSFKADDVSNTDESPRHARACTCKMHAYRMWPLARFNVYSLSIPLCIDSFSHIMHFTTAGCCRKRARKLSSLRRGPPIYSVFSLYTYQTIRPTHTLAYSRPVSLTYSLSDSLHCASMCVRVCALTLHKCTAVENFSIKEGLSPDDRSLAYFCTS